MAKAAARKRVTVIKNKHECGSSASAFNLRRFARMSGRPTPASDVSTSFLPSAQMLPNASSQRAGRSCPALRQRPIPAG